MALLARRNLLYDKLRFAVTLTGIVFAILLMVVQFGLFISPIAFSTADVPAQWRTWYALNPLVGIIDGFRWSLLGGQVPLDAAAVLISAAMTAALIVLGVWYFRRMEAGFADVI